MESNVASPEIKDEEIEAEERHFALVLSTFRYYRTCLEEKFKKRIVYIESLPSHQQRLLTEYKKSLTDVMTCIKLNQDLIDEILKDADQIFYNKESDFSKLPKVEESHSLAEMERVQATLKQFVREWSTYGAAEREACYGPILREIKNFFPASERDPEEVMVLVPGSGLGRLPYEIASLGYTCQGNDFSLFMLIASYFVINKTDGINAHQVFPWVGQVDNNMNTENQIQCVHFPDVYPGSVLNLSSARFTMAAGDFLEVYSADDEWDCVATCYFIDCAPNIVEFIEHIYKVLKAGGIWVNLGPLTYHFSNSPNLPSIEPQYNILRDIITGIGFEREKEQVNMRMSYCQNLGSMSRHENDCVFFVYRKPVPVPVQ